MQDATGTSVGSGTPSGPRARWGLGILAVLLLGTVAVMQRPEDPDPAKVKEARTGSVVEPVTYSPLIGIGKVVLWFQSQTNDGSAAQLLDMGDQYAQTAADKFRMSVLAGEVAGDVKREARLEKLEKDLDENSPLREDIKTLRAIKADPANIGAVDVAAKTGLKARHGWFARLLLAGETPGGEAAFERQVAEDGALLAGVLILAFFFLGAAVLAGIVVLIVGIVKVANGTLRPRFVATPQEFGGDRGLWLETLCVFLAGFIAVHGAHYLMEKRAAPEAMWPTFAALGMQWLLASVLFWPVLRGMSWERFRGELGWHRGRGVLREIGCGVLGYLAGLPIYFGMAIVIVIASYLAEMVRRAAAGGKAPDMPLPDNKVFDLIEHASGWGLMLLASLIVLWAPLVEEGVFRGALFRHLRQRLRGWGGLMLTVALVAAAFALAHSYVLAGVIMVATLGGLFALMREWRGSLIAPMTAHCLHNTMVLTLLLTLLPLMRG